MYAGLGVVSLNSSAYRIECWGQIGLGPCLDIAIRFCYSDIESFGVFSARVQGPLVSEGQTLEEPPSV